MKTIALLSFVAIGLASVLASAQVTSSQVAEYDRDRAAKIIEAFNQKPESLIAPLTAASVRLVGGVGRVDVNPKAKFSYYAQTEEATNPHSKILLIPMATSRFTPTYYQTDEWWDAHNDQKRLPLVSLYFL